MVLRRMSSCPSRRYSTHPASARGIGLYPVVLADIQHDRPAAGHGRDCLHGMRELRHPQIFRWRVVRVVLTLRHHGGDDRARGHGAGQGQR